MNKWLQNFAYRIFLGPEVFLINAFLLFFIVFVTVSYKTVNTALSNPAQSLRYERAKGSFRIIVYKENLIISDFVTINDGDFYSRSISQCGVTI
jgi:hypothetical protein